MNDIFTILRRNTQRGNAKHALLGVRRATCVATIAAVFCYFSGRVLLVVSDRGCFSNFIEVDSLSTKNFKAMILNLNFNFNSNGHV